jgi:hypothetical protein
LLNSACTAGEAEEQAQANDDGAQNKRRRGQRALSMSGWYVAALWNGCTGGAYLKRYTSSCARTRGTAAQDVLLNFAIDQQPIALQKL